MKREFQRQREQRQGYIKAYGSESGFSQEGEREVEVLIRGIASCLRKGQRLKKEREPKLNGGGESKRKEVA